MKNRIAAAALFFASLAAPLAHAEDEAGGKEITIEEFLQQLSTVPGVVQRKDPFAQVAPPFPEETVNEAGDGPNPNLPPLVRYVVTEYEVVAVLLGERYPRALLRLPDASKKVVIVKEGDALGSQKGKISKITSEGLLVVQSQRSSHGFVDKAEILLKVGGKMTDQAKALKAVNGK